MARLEVDGNKSIYYEDLGGDGRAMVLIHGWGMDNRCWDGVILPLQAAGHRVITMDHPMARCLQRQNDTIPAAIVHTPAMNQHHGTPIAAQIFVINTLATVYFQPCHR